MHPARPSSSFVVRVLHQGGAQHITLQDLRSGEMREFSSWEALTQYLRTLTRERRLK
jgi:hypothetical protein